MQNKQKVKSLIIGNWKMNPVRLKEAEKLFSSISKNSKDIKKVEIIACPPFVYLEKLKKISKKIKIGAQNASWKDSGAFTGEISATMLGNIGVKYVILGHSERREMGENNELINKKIKSVISAGLLPILCVGEKNRDENHIYLDFVKSEIEECLNGISKNLIQKVIIAYEPIWAISTTLDRKDATAEDSLEMTIFIRKIISGLSSVEIAKDIRILYGGSINDKDAEEFLKNGGVNGLLVGRASLDEKKFLKIINIAENI